MRLKFPRLLLITLIFSIALLASCKEKIESKEQIMTDEVYTGCQKSNSKTCLEEAIKSRTENYCSSKTVPQQECDQIKLDVLHDVQVRQDREYEEIQRKIQDLKKKNAELQRQNDRADEILRK